MGEAEAQVKGGKFYEQKQKLEADIEDLDYKINILQKEIYEER